MTNDKTAPAGDGVSILIISYNTREMTLACLASVAAQTTVPHQVIVVDNASTDGSAEAIAAQFPDVTLIAETTNHGFAGAHPIAVAEARYPYLLLLNPDTVVLDGAIDELMAFAAARPDAGIWGGRTVFADGTLNPTSCWGKMTVWSLFCAATGLARLRADSSLFNPEGYGGWDRDSVRAVDIVTGCLLLIRRADWDALGGFDPDFFMYGEEADLCLRAQAMGLSPHITPKATIIHYGGASERVMADKVVRLLRGKVALIRRHFDPKQRGIGLFLLRAWVMSRAYGYATISRLIGKASHADAAATWGNVWKRRAEWRDGYRASDHPG